MATAFFDVFVGSGSSNVTRNGILVCNLGTLNCELTAEYNPAEQKIGGDWQLRVYTDEENYQDVQFYVRYPNTVGQIHW